MCKNLESPRSMAGLSRKFQAASFVHRHSHQVSEELDPGVKGPPSLDTLRSTMSSTVKDWKNHSDTRLTNARDNFLEFSQTLVVFSDLFSIIPQGDKYVSLFTGVLSTTITACDPTGVFSRVQDSPADCLFLAVITSSVRLTRAYTRLSSPSLVSLALRNLR